MAIYTKSKNGDVVALKGLCDHIITKSKIKNNNLNLTQEQIDDIHSRGKITPLEKVKELCDNNELNYVVRKKDGKFQKK